jgi:hypothetical protein
MQESDTPLIGLKKWDEEYCSARFIGGPLVSYLQNMYAAAARVLCLDTGMILSVNEGPSSVSVFEIMC